MKIKLICNCGLAFESGGQILLLDALTQELAPFYRAPEKTRREIIAGEGEYASVCGILFTHLHPDHFGREAAEEFSARHKTALVYVPSRREPAPETLSIGNFTVELHRVRHTQVAGYGKSTVDAMIVSCEGKCVYVASDTAPEAAIHEGVLRGRKVDAAFWNGEMLLYKPEREMLHDCADRSFIYHIPVDPQDGLRRKLERIVSRYPEELENVRLLTAYPSVISL